MRLFAVGVEFTHHVAAERLEYADARQHKPATPRSQQLGSGARPRSAISQDPVLPFGDVGRGVPECHELPGRSWHLRLPQPLHSKLNVGRLQQPPAFDRRSGNGL